MKKILSFFFALLSFSFLLFLPTKAQAGILSIYDNIPSPLPGNLLSLGYEANSVKEFGGQIQFADSLRNNPLITVLMSSWGCENGAWYTADCVTSPGSSFSHPITLNIYEVNPDNSPGSLLYSITDTFNIPYRPSSDNVNCTGGRWYDGTNCFSGALYPVTYDLSTSGLTLPDKVILAVAYNTTHHGYSPIGEAACYSEPGGCGYDSLNVAVTYPPTVGTTPLSADAYLYSTWSDAYCSGIGGSFRLDTECWGGYQPSFKVEVQFEDPTPTAIPAPPSGDCINYLTGPNSINKCIVKNVTRSRVTVNNTGSVTSNVKSRSNTGNNTSNNNTQGGSIQTGDATTGTSVSTTVNTTRIRTKR